jgi:spore maturation protein CgeB
LRRNLGALAVIGRAPVRHETAREGRPVGELTTIVVFPTLAPHLNMNPDIPRYVVSALRRVLGPEIHVIEASSADARDMITSMRPGLALGIGSAARGETDFAGVWRASRRSGTALAYWLHDEPYEFDFAWRVQERCDWLFVNDRASTDYYRQQAVAHLPLAASLDHHFRALTPLAERRVDVFFCGYGYGNRCELLGRLQRSLAAVKTQVFGAAWPTELAFCHNRRLSGAEITAGYGDARITLNIGRHHNLANRRLEIVASTPGPRTFEGAAAGALQVMFLEGLEVSDSYRLGHEILAFNNVGEFEAILDDVLARPGYYDRVVEAAQDRTRRHHTYDARVSSLLATLTAANLISGIAR